MIRQGWHVQQGLASPSIAIEDCQQRDANSCRVLARSLENNYQEGALGMLPEGTGINAPQVPSAPPLCQQQLQDACAILFPNPRSSNSHFHPVVCNDSSCPLVLPAVALVVNAYGVDDANVAAGSALPQVNGADVANFANGTPTPIFQPINIPLNAAAGMAGGGETVHCPLANNLLPAHPGLPTTSQLVGLVGNSNFWF
jgi:hypothetical protein